MAYFSESLKIWEKIETSRGIADCLNNIGLIYSKNGEFAQAMSYHIRSLDIRRSIQDTIGVASSHNNIGDVYAKQGQYGKAIEYNKKAFQIANGVGNVLITRNVCNALYQEYKAIGNQGKALEMYEQFIELDDSIRNIKNQKKILNIEYENKSAEDSLQEAHRAEQAWFHTSLAVSKFEAEKAKSNFWSLGLGGIILVLLLVFGIIRIRSQRKLTRIELNNKQKLVKAMINGLEDERKRISRELHDGIGAGLIAAKFKLISDSPKDAYPLIEKSIKEIRDLSHQLIPPEIEEQNIEQSLEAYISSIKADLPLTIEWMAVGEFNEVRPEVKISIYRITQECISNAIKYSNASELVVQLLEDGDELTLMVEDDGVGFIISENAQGIGLNNIRSRVEDLDGQIEIDSTIGHGTTIMVRIRK
ncbi:MAG: sensor histidine kinase [Flavobacteriales bacterium]|nr:sensor histidine kinase [Flavobacteriales bacterium]